MSSSSLRRRRYELEKKGEEKYSRNSKDRTVELRDQSSYRACQLRSRSPAPCRLTGEGAL